MKRAFSLMALACALLPAPVGADSPVARDVWYRILGNDGALIGWQHETLTPEPDGATVVRERAMAFRIDGHEPTRYRQRIERTLDGEGRTLRYTVTTWQGDEPQGRSFRIMLKQAQRVDDPESMLALEVLPEATGLQPGLMLETSHYNVAAAGGTPVQEISWKHAGPYVMALKRGLPVIAWRISRAPSGEVQEAVQPLFGSQITYQRAPGPIEAAQLSDSRAIPHQMLAAPFAIGRSALRGHIRYVFDQAQPQARLLPTSTGEQRISVNLEAQTLTLDVCADCGVTGLPSDPESLARARSPAPWLQSDAPEFQRAVRSIAASSRPDAKKMEALGRLARKHLPNVDYNGHLTALDAWKRGAGDCTEDAVVLATLARAAGIPALVANGLVYSRERYHGAANAFIPHSWVIAHVDGAWRSFDISTGKFDASHIALIVGDGEAWTIATANQAAALLEWRGMAEVRIRPAS